MSKKCILCDKAATVFVTLISNGLIKSACYCDEHAKEIGLFNDHAYNLIYDEKNVEIKKIIRPNICPECGYTFEEFEKTKCLGCKNCYKHFFDKVKAVLNVLYEENVHLGKVPSSHKSSAAFIPRKLFLMQKIDALVALEKYEDAAKINKILKRYKN